MTTPRTDIASAPDDTLGGGLGRRRFLCATGGAFAATAVGGMLAGCGGSDSKPRATASRTIRLLSVITPMDSGLLGHLLPRFERETGYHVQVRTGQDVYGPARAGKADLVLSHYGHPDVHEFVLGGYGEWPRTVLQNQIALVGPPADPARVRGLNDVVQAYRQIASSRARYVVDAIPELRYLNDIIDQAAGSPPKGNWHLTPGLKGQDAVKFAAAHGAYTLFGVTPFLVGQGQRHLQIEPLVLGDPMFLRVMATIVVSATKVNGVNHSGALALQEHLLTTRTQAEIRDYRTPGIKQGLWWPAGRNNEASLLPLDATKPVTPGSGTGGGTGGGGGGGGGGGRGRGSKHQTTG